MVGTKPRDEALIDAILAAPDDDTPRLVYADVLTERGDPSGELIIVQCARARLAREGKRGRQEDAALFERERELATKQDLVFRTLLPNVRIEPFERGLITRIGLSPPSLHELWPVLIRLPLRTIALRYGSPADIAIVASHPTVQRIEIAANRKDDFNDATLDASVIRTQPSADKGEIWSSDLPHEHLLPALCRLSVRSPHVHDFALIRKLPNLDELVLTGPHRLGAADLARVHELAHLTKLTMRAWSAEMRQVFLEAAPPPKLRELTVRGGPLGEIARMPALPQLEALRTNMVVTDALFAAIDADARALTTLSVEWKPSGGFAAFLDSGIPGRLQRLCLRCGGHRPTREDRAPVFGARFPRLRELELQACTLDADDAAGILRDLDHVEELSIRTSNIDTPGWERLLERWPLGRFGW